MLTLSRVPSRNSTDLPRRSSDLARQAARADIWPIIKTGYDLGQQMREKLLDPNVRHDLVQLKLSACPKSHLDPGKAEAIFMRNL